MAEVTFNFRVREFKSLSLDSRLMFENDEETYLRFVDFFVRECLCGSESAPGLVPVLIPEVIASGGYPPTQQ